MYDENIHDMVEYFVEVFMDDLLVFGESFELCLINLDRVFARCEETNMVLNREKCHFLVKEGIVLGHKISKNGLEVDKAKVEVIEAPILVAPNWELPFELLCDSTDIVVGAALG